MVAQFRTQGHQCRCVGLDFLQTPPVEVLPHLGVHHGRQNRFDLTRGILARGVEQRLGLGAPVEQPQYQNLPRKICGPCDGAQFTEMSQRLRVIARVLGRFSERQE